jgi:DNA replication protein DnaC
MSGAAAKGRVDLDGTRQALEQLGLLHAAERLPELLSEAVKQNLATHRFVDQLLAVELSQREERRIKTSPRLSGLPTGQTLANFDFAFQPSIEKSRIETLATCAWIREHETTRIGGPPGVGTSHLAIALGVEHGFSVAFFRLDELLHAMKQDANLSPQALRRRKYLNVALLIIDEMGFQPLNRQPGGKPALPNGQLPLSAR